jgi:hypothetical protein
MHLTPQGCKYYSYVEGKNANPEGVTLWGDNCVSQNRFSFNPVHSQLPNTQSSIYVLPFTPVRESRGMLLLEMAKIIPRPSADSSNSSS